MPHRTALPAPHESPQLSSLLLQPLCFCVLPCTLVITTAASNLLSAPQKTLRNVGICMEVGKGTFGNGNKPFWGGIMSCMTLTQSRMAAAYAQNSPFIEAPPSLPSPFLPGSGFVKSQTLCSGDCFQDHSWITFYILPGLDDKSDLQEKLNTVPKNTGVIMWAVSRYPSPHQDTHHPTGTGFIGIKVILNLLLVNP